MHYLPVMRGLVVIVTAPQSIAAIMTNALWIAIPTGDAEIPPFTVPLTAP